MKAWSKATVRRIATLGAQANATAAVERATGLKPHVVDTLAEGWSLRAGATWLNDRGVKSPGGGNWFRSRC